MEAFGGTGDEPRELRFYQRMRFIRRFEETLLGLFEEGVLNDTTHACIGQEANAVAVTETLRECLSSDDRVVLIGEDIVDPYGGAFMVTRGLSTEVPQRVLSTPISEGAIAGMSAGLALAGMRPIVELLVPAHLNPTDWEPIEQSVMATASLVTVEEGTAGWSWGTEIAVVMSERLFGRLRRPIAVVASQRTVIPFSRGKEATMLVGSRQIEAEFREAAT